MQSVKTHRPYRKRPWLLRVIEMQCCGQKQNRVGKCRGFMGTADYWKFMNCVDSKIGPQKIINLDTNKSCFLVNQRINLVEEIFRNICLPKHRKYSFNSWTLLIMKIYLLGLGLVNASKATGETQAKIIPSLYTIGFYKTITPTRNFLSQQKICTSKGKLMWIAS